MSESSQEQSKGQSKEPSAGPSEARPPQAKGGFLGNLAFNIVIPVLILSKLSGEDSLGPSLSIVFALAFPISYGLWDLRQSGKVNPFSVLGVVSVFLTGGISLLQLDPKYIAIKEAAIPAIIGIAVLMTQRTRFPLVKTLILNAQLVRVDALYAALERSGKTGLFERRLGQASLIVAGQIKGLEPRLFLIYPEGNFIESTDDTPFFQIGETKYGKPIIDRVMCSGAGSSSASRTSRMPRMGPPAGADAVACAK